MARLGRSVVLGAGLAGIAAAAALLGVSDEVVLVERDELPPDPRVRRGVPQGDQLHNLLACAQVNLEQLLPGFLAALRAEGCGDARVSSETHVFELGVRMPERDLGLRLMCAWRPVVEHVARALLCRDERVRVLDGVAATGLRLDGAGAVTGAEVASVEPGTSPTVIGSTLVVDATGTGSPAHRWLARCGKAPPRVDRREYEQWYATVLVERPPSHVGDPAYWLTFGTAPRARSGLVSPVSPSEWHVSLSGRGSDLPPRSYEQMLEYAATLEDPAIGRLLTGARPLRRAHVFRKPVASWRRYDLLDSPVPGFLPIGDAVATLNPLFGQGISVASWQAVELKAAVAEADVATAEGIVAATGRYLARSARGSRAAWALGHEVRQDPADTGAPSSSELGAAIVADTAAHRRFVRMWHLMQPEIGELEEERELVATVEAGGGGRGSLGKEVPA